MAIQERRASDYKKYWNKIKLVWEILYNPETGFSEKDNKEAFLSILKLEVYTYNIIIRTVEMSTDI